MIEEWNEKCYGKSECTFNPTHYLNEEAFAFRPDVAIEYDNPAANWGEYYYYEFETPYFEVEWVDPNARRRLLQELEEGRQLQELDEDEVY